MERLRPLNTALGQGSLCRVLIKYPTKQPIGMRSTRGCHKVNVLTLL